MPRSSRSVAIAAVLVLAGCGGEAPADDEPPRCDVPFTVPSGFEVTGGIEDPYPDRLGVRVDMRGEAGRELHFFVGIPGEFGEGLPDAGTLQAAGGGGGTLLGRDDVWVFLAGTGSGCADRAVLGSGMQRPAFIELLLKAGAVAP